MYDRAIFIPASDERALLPGAIKSLSQLPYRSLLVIVLNNRDDAEDSVKSSNLATHNWLLSYPHEKVDARRTDIAYPNLDIRLLDYHTRQHCLGVKQGVGMARHIGASECLKLWDSGALNYPIIWSTDADARFGPDYLDAFKETAGVYTLPYFHTKASAALILYELSLRYYTLGLDFCRSPYGYPTIGSSIAFHAESYRTTKGFPDRLAGEDFYWLNKARKVATFSYPHKNAIELIDRPSDRVPFGTGKGMASISAQKLNLTLYDPTIFKVLKIWIDTLNQAADAELIPRLKSIFPEYDGYIRLSKVISQACTGKRVFRRRHEFFDAFRTMRWVHQYRDCHCPNIPWKDAMAQASWCPELSELSLKEIQNTFFKLEFNTLRQRLYPQL